jgi:hydroxymethylbilane synthase
MKNTLTVATRSGRLATAQTEIVISMLKQYHPDLEIQIKYITTEGDRDRQTALWQLKDSGFFTSKIEQALLEGVADFAVHSFKDLPTKSLDGLKIAAVCDRRFIADCMIATEKISSINQLPKNAKVGTSSLRRIAQIKNLRPDLETVPIRGNVSTRIKRVDKKDVDAVILARAGLERMGLEQRISFDFEPRQFIPAPAQGALAVQTRSNDRATNDIIVTIDDKKARLLTLAERQVLVTMQCGCHAPVGASAEYDQDNIIITAFICDIQGKNMIKQSTKGPAMEAIKLADSIAEQLLDAGGSNILKEIEKTRNNGSRK